jgi:hypothetical protein
MKPVLMAMGGLLVVIFGFAWLNGKSTNKKIIVPIDRQIFFESDSLKVNSSSEIVIKGKSDKGKISGFNLEFQYDVGYLKIESVDVNGEVFTKSQSSKIDDSFGKILISGEAGKNQISQENGEVVLAIIKVSGKRKGGTVILGGRKPAVMVMENGVNSDGNFSFGGYKLSIL